MPLRKTIIFTALLFIELNSVPVAADNKPTPRAIVGSEAWKREIKDKEFKILHVSNDGAQWFDVSPPSLIAAVQQLPTRHQTAVFLMEFAELDPLDTQRAWLAFQPENKGYTASDVVLEYSSDGGQHWQKTTAPVRSDNIHISFVDEKRGFLLSMGGLGIGPHEKKVYGTQDGGKTWVELGAPPGKDFIAEGIAFRNPNEGWITGEYRGDDFFPLYRTVDGGKTWKLQSFPIPNNNADGCYANIQSPVFTGEYRKQGILSVQLIRGKVEMDVNYDSKDGGATWHLPASGIRLLTR